MPNKTKKTGKSKQAKRRSRGGPSNGSRGFDVKRGMPMTFSAYPAVNKSYLAFAQVRTLTEGGAGAGTYYQYRLNSIYDPDFSGAGSTAVGYTQMSNLFGSYRVTRTRIKLRFSSLSSGVQTVGFVAGLNTTFIASYEKIAAEPNTWARMLTNTSGPNSMAELDCVLDLPKLCGITRRQYIDENDYSATFGNNPARNLYLSLYTYGSSASAQSVAVDVRLVFEVEFFQPLQYYA